ncbi:MAG: hypothetical protein QM723_28235 [Myxococcaceae bacterium]
MNLPRTEEHVAQLLVKAKVLDEMQIKAASSKIGLWGKHLPKVVAELGFVEEDVMTETIAKALNLPITRLGQHRGNREAQSKLDVEFCQLHSVFPYAIHGRTLEVVMVDPTDIYSVDQVKIRAGMRVQGLLGSETEIVNAILRHYLGQEPKAPQRGRNAGRKLTDEAPLELDMAKPLDPKGSSSDAKPGMSFNKEDTARLEAAWANQQKAATILRAVRELLTEKGYLKR